MSRLKPAVPRRVLLLLAGLVWSGVGVMLLVYAAGWIAGAGWGQAWYVPLVGIPAALLAGWSGLARLARRNVARIRAGPERPCLFSFQAARSYVIVAVMIGGGLALRASPLSRVWLALLYLTMGGALLTASFTYYLSFVRCSDRPEVEPEVAGE